MNVEIIKNKQIIHIVALVESESKEGFYYKVINNNGIWACSCPQNSIKGKECKHIKSVIEEL